MLAGRSDAACLVGKAWDFHVEVALGISQDTFLAQAWMYARTIRFADGPDEVHRGVISKEELKKHAEA